MNRELSVIEEFGARLEPSAERAATAPAQLRRRVMAGLREDPGRRPWAGRTGLREDPGRRPWAGRARLRARVALGLGMPVGALSVALLLGQVSDVGIGGDTSHDTRTSQTAVGGEAGRILRLAAHYVETAPVMPARPDQFLRIDAIEYRIEDVVARGADGRPTITGARAVGPLNTRTWLSVDGTRDGLRTTGPADSAGGTETTRTRIPACRAALRVESGATPEQTRQADCTPRPAYQQADLPTDPDAMLRYLYRAADQREGFVYVSDLSKTAKATVIRLSSDQRAFDKLAAVLYETHAPRVQAAAFRAAERIPGVEVRRNVADASGRTGVAVTRTEAGSRRELVFDEKTYGYLGTNAIAVEIDPASLVSGPVEHGGKPSQIEIRGVRKPGDVMYRSAILGFAIVDEVGQ